MGSKSRVHFKSRRGRRKKVDSPRSHRSDTEGMQLRESSEDEVNFIHDILTSQLDLLIEALQSDGSVEEVLNNSVEQHSESVLELFLNTAIQGAENIVIEKRSSVSFREVEEDLLALIQEAVENDGIINLELEAINSTTVKGLSELLIEGLDKGMTQAQLASAIMDSPLFSLGRAKVIANTIVGTAQSLGQLVYAKELNAETKTWHDSNLHVREEHRKRDGETVALGSKFSSQFEGASPRYPLDPLINPSDRIGCRCAMSFGFLD